ncbi:MAG: cytochrome P450 [Solirubrobacteraceae bacterium]
MSFTGPEPLSTNPLRRVAFELQTERRARGGYPPGDTSPSLRRTHRMIVDPLALLLEAYERHGPVFSLRILNARNVFMLGPEANHFMLVSHADRFRWRDGGFGDLIPLLGDGMLTIDGDFHRQSRRAMLPAFHHERVQAARGVMDDEIERALAPWQDGLELDLYAWARELALRVAMRALFGFDPDARRDGVHPAREFERALGFYGREYWLQILRGPGTPMRALTNARGRLDGLIYAEISRRRRTGERGEDVLSLLLDAPFTDRHVRDHVMTLLFAGHDTTTATIAFFFYELARHPEIADAIKGNGALLDQALEETLRLYPPAWIGPRRAAEAFEFGGHRIAAGAPVNYSSWASHRLPDVWDAPHEFRPERFSPEQRGRIPKGAYVPFGGGSRICLGMRFGQLEIKAIAAAVTERFSVELPAGSQLRIRQTPTLGPCDGLPVRVRVARGTRED